MQNRRKLGVVAHSLLVGLFLLGAGLAARADAPDAAPNPDAPKPDDVRIKAPALPEGVRWINSPPLTMEQLRGKVVLVDFWEYTCINCIRTLPYLTSWNDKYRDKGLVILGVHAPEFQFAKKPANVEKAAHDFGLTYPLIVDSDHAVWDAYGNRFWPAKYLIDAEGYVRYYHFGEGGYGATEQRIQDLLKQANPKVELPALGEPVRGSDRPGAVCYPTTPELYLGFERGALEGTLANREGYHPNNPASYRDPGKWEDGYVYLNGRWVNGREAVVSAGQPGPRANYVAVKYHALEVNAVLKPESGKPVKVWVYHDGKPVAKGDEGKDLRFDPQGRSYLLVDEPRMYHILKNRKFGQRTLKLAAAGAGLGVYTFTFASCEVEHPH